MNDEWNYNNKAYLQFLFNINQKMTNKLLLLSLFTFSISSCYMNKTFLKPQKMASDSKSITIRDSMVTYFNGANFQLTFTKFGKDTLHYSFTVKSIIFDSKSGNKLNAWILTPKKIIPKITLIHFHGNGGMLLSQFKAISPLVEQGFQVFMFDYSGFGFSEGEAKRNYVLEDGLSAIDYVKSDLQFANTKIVVYGQSFGGHLATVAATIKQNDIDGLVTEGAFSSHDDIAGESFWTIMARLSVREIYAAKKYIKNFKKPVLIIHSTEDKIIPFKMAKKLYKNANQPKELYEIKGNHIWGPILYPKQITEKISKMLNS